MQTRLEFHFLSCIRSLELLIWNFLAYLEATTSARFYIPEAKRKMSASFKIFVPKYSELM